MNRLYIWALLCCFVVHGITAQEVAPKYYILLTGASFASHHNGWFELGCSHLGASPINKAIGGESIVNTANKMTEGLLYSFEELEEIDAMVIMHVHDRDVFDESQLLQDLNAYPKPFNRNNYAIAYDYVIKKYISDCYELRNNPQSRYYHTATGKPASIVLCTNWHDGRVLFNTSIRKLAAKWGLPIVEFDTHVGFSRHTVHPVTGEQQSLLYAQDTQMADGIKHGWHPKRGKHEYIQQRMAAVFADVMRTILPFKEQPLKADQTL